MIQVDFSESHRFAIAGLLLLVADAGLAANLYSTREWEELEDEVVRERHPRRRVAGR